jgi:hypothetical protein
MTAWRSAVRDSAVTTCEAFVVENDELVDRVFRSRPASLAETRSIFIGPISENIRHDSGTWQRIADVEIICTKHLTDNEETSDDLEEMADALIEYLSAFDTVHAFGANTVQEPIRSVQIEIPDGGIFIPAIAITCRATIQSGRS